MHLQQAGFDNPSPKVIFLVLHSSAYKIDIRIADLAEKAPAWALSVFEGRKEQSAAHIR